MKTYLTPERVLTALANLPQLVFEVTDACNLRCKYCAYGEFYEDYDHRDDQMLPVERAIRLIDYYTDLLFDKETLEAMPTGTCMPFSKKMFVTVNGKILPCERIGHQFALGKITETEIELNPAQIADKYNSYYAKMHVQCSKCKNSKACVQCMFYIENMDNKPVCHGYMNDTEFRNYTNRQMRFLEQHPEAYQKIMKEVIVL